MCGIAGIVDLAQRGVSKTILEGMCGHLTHRGPDETGYYTNHEVGFGQTRLSIIDLSTGKQPMANEDGTVWVTFNGEIYNFKELRLQLEKCGHRFSTTSDTEVIVHAYEQFGADCVQHFRGMFAFAIWDSKQRTAFLARDRVGKKPLFYAIVDGQLVFASELQAIIRYPGIDGTPSAAAINEYLTYGYIPAPRTIFEQVRKVPPAHHLTCRLDVINNEIHGIKLERYWELRYAPKQAIVESEAVEGLVEVLTEATRLRMIADVPLGALLSGGIDSSLVVAIMSRLSRAPVKTFSIGFDEREFDELPFARAVARQYATEHHELVVRASALDVLPLLVRHYGEPFADSSAIPSYYVSKLTRQHVKVALNGDGGDESFAGYERYLGSLLADRLRKLPSFVLGSLQMVAGKLAPGGASRRSRLQQFKRLVDGAALPPDQRYLIWMSIFSPSQKASLYRSEFQTELRGEDAEKWLCREYQSISGENSDLDTLLALDIRTYLPYDLLVKMDIATMACSLEARSPFLDHQVMEFAATLPDAFKIRGTTLKYLLKKAGASMLPLANLRRRKMGFGVPVAAWMRNELRPLLEDCLLAKDARISSYFQLDSLRMLVAEHIAGQRDHSSQLWALLWLELWHREFLS